MIEVLNEALALLDLKPGETYRTTVNGRELEVRAVEASNPDDEISEFADQVMLNPWFTTPNPPPQMTFTLKLGKLRLPDPPIIPPEYEGFEMIYIRPSDEDRLDQGDLLDDCPILDIGEFQLGAPGFFRAELGFRRVVVVTQGCDLANAKTTGVNVAEALDTAYFVDQKLLKAADIKGPLRSGRIWGMYFLPACEDLGLNEMIVDFRRLHTVRLDLLEGLCRSGKRRARLQTPYREHLAKHFADSFSRIGLPQPYETL